MKGDLEVTINSVRRYNKEVMQGIWEETPPRGSVFVGVVYSIKNIAEEPTSQSIEVFLTNPTGTTYESVGYGTALSYFHDQMNADERFLVDLNPGVSFRGVELYNAAPSELAKPGWTLRVRAGGIFETPIQIPLTF